MAALAVAAMAALGSGHISAWQGSGDGSQNKVQGTEEAQGKAMGARALVERGARLWCRAGMLGVERAEAQGTDAVQGTGGRLTVGEAHGRGV